jgi:nitric oxide reductase NorQ protein
MEWVYFNASCLLESTDWMAQVQLRGTPQGGTATEWIPTPILRTLERAQLEPNRLFAIQIDEISRARPSSLSGIFPCIDGTRLYYNPITSSFHPVSPNIVWLAAANVGASYRGTYLMDLALLDRFAPIEVQYPPHDAEIKLLQRRFPQLEAKWVHKVVSVANKLRGDPNSPTDISMRATQEVCLLLSHPLYATEIETHLEEVLRSSFCGRHSGHMAQSGADSSSVREAIKAAMNVERKTRGKK